MRQFFSKLLGLNAMRMRTRTRPGSKRVRLSIEQFEGRLLMDGGLATNLIDANLVTSTALVSTTQNQFGLNDMGGILDNPGFVGQPVAPKLDSFPGAPATLFLSFTGNFESQWGEHQNVFTPAFSLDSDRHTFNADEVAMIKEIWTRVADDFSPFNINVTTQYTGAFNDGEALKIAIGGKNSDWSGEATAWGLSFVGSFTSFDPNVGFVFSDSILEFPHDAEGAKHFGAAIADAASHEAGHAFGLFHQSLWDLAGGTVEEYHPGTEWSKPIMGSGALSDPKYGSTWMTGPTIAGPDVIQDDMAVIAQENGFGFRADDHGNTVETATALTSDYLFLPRAYTAKGVIEQPSNVKQHSDIDFFRFNTPGGLFKFRIEPAKFGSNLSDLYVTFYDSAGKFFETHIFNSREQLDLDVQFAPGRYFVSIAARFGDGLNLNGNAFGQYQVTVDFEPGQMYTAMAFMEQTGVVRLEDSVLSVNATNGDDVITFARGKKGAMIATVNGVEIAKFAKGTVSEIVVHGLAGDDTITLDPKLAIKAFLDGGADDDTLAGGAAADIVLGGLGKDRLLGRKGRDVMIGGPGADRLEGGADEDLLIASYWLQDTDENALRAVLQEWTSPRAYAERITRLETGADGLPVLGQRRVSTRLGDLVDLLGPRVIDDGVSDVLDGGAAKDWFFAAAADEIFKRSAKEKLNVIPALQILDTGFPPELVPLTQASSR